ncbi:AMP-binding protein [Staphylospora marina]|uniref:AMP-binding protein n=1 Tax=Staphylospora marina TaxID=2490858 RepID=UPI0013DE1139|nr:AMP-binding protein [Staphylospora marina]
MKPHNLVEMLWRTVKRHPERIALLQPKNGSLTRMNYRKLWDMIHDFAFGLDRIGIRPGTKVAIRETEDAHRLIAEFAVLSLGAVTVPVPEDAFPGHAEYILEDSGAEAFLESRADSLSRLRLPGRVRHRILLRGTPTDEQAVLRFDTVLQMGQTMGDVEWDWHWPAVQPPEPATVRYTKGTTGWPKGVIFSHQQLLANLDSLSHVYPVMPEDLVLAVDPDHAGWTAGPLTALQRGASLLLAGPCDSLTRLLRETKPTVVVLPAEKLESLHRELSGSILRSPVRRMLLRRVKNITERARRLSRGEMNGPVPPGLRLAHALAHAIVLRRVHGMLGGRIRRLIVPGASVDPGASDFFRHLDIPVTEAYALTEGAIITWSRPGHDRPGTSGYPLPGVELRLRPDGELLVKSPSVMTGYLHRDEETARALSGGWLHTGDLAEPEPDGAIRILGRKPRESLEAGEPGSRTCLEDTDPFGLLEDTVPPPPWEKTIPPMMS